MEKHRVNLLKDVAELNSSMISMIQCSPEYPPKINKLYCIGWGSPLVKLFASASKGLTKSTSE